MTQRYKGAIEAYLARTGFKAITPKVALIDMDGTLYDSMPRHAEAWHRMVADLNIDIPAEEFFMHEGRTGAATINIIFRKHFGREATPEEIESLYKKKTEYFAEMPPVYPMPGASDMLRELISRNIKRVLVTGSGQNSLISRLDSDFPGAFLPEMRITARDVKRGKPAPDPFIEGMKKAGTRPWESIVIENAPLGTEAGAASQAFTIAVNTGPIPAEALRNAGADIVFDSMEECARQLPALLDEMNSYGESQTLIFSNNVATEIDSLIKDMSPSGVWIITDRNVNSVVLPKLLSQSTLLSSAKVIVTEPGDTAKNLTTLSEIWAKLVETGANRRSLVINIGGGVVTDMGGFAAATFKRGVRFINVPTTLLSAVDAAVGGKTGINFLGLKNEIGAFCNADAVVISTCFFSTLPQCELLSGYAEMLKHGLLSGADDFHELLKTDVAALSDSTLLTLLRKSVMVKKRVVDEDPTEKGLRKALNLGHTPGHAFESWSLAKDKPVPHGYAVAWGLVVDLTLSSMKYGFPGNELRLLANFVRDNYGVLPISCNDYESLLEYMRHDKKNTDGENIRFSLLSAPGEVKLDATASPDEITAAFDIFRDLMGI